MVARGSTFRGGVGRRAADRLPNRTVGLAATAAALRVPTASLWVLRKTVHVPRCPLTDRHHGPGEALKLREQLLLIYASAHAHLLDLPWYASGT